VDNDKSKAHINGAIVGSEVVKRTAIARAIKTWWKPWTWFRKDITWDYFAVEVLHPPGIGDAIVIMHDVKTKEK
jgi:hypothetical protein